MSATIEPTSTGVTIHMNPPQPQQSSPAASTGTAVCTITSGPTACLVSSSSATSSTTKMSMSSSSSTTKTTKITKTTSYSSKSSTTTTTTKTGGSQHKTITTKTSSSSYSDNLANMLGIDSGKEMERLQSLLNDQMSKMHSEMFTLRIQGSSDAATPESSLVRLDKSSIMDYVDKQNSDNLRFNFDMGQYSSESVHVKTVGNQIEVHAQRKTKTADGETCEEYSRTYEMPTSAEICPEKVSSNLFKEGVLTVELPVSEAIKEGEQ